MSSAPKIETIKVRKLSTQLTDKIPTRDEVKVIALDILDSLLKNLLPYGDEFSISSKDGEKTTIISIDCSKRNLSHLIGKNGKNIDALRRVTSNIFARKGYRAIIEIPYFAPDEE